VTVQRKLNDSNYVIRKGKGKCVVIHVDRMQKLPISSLDEGESSADMLTDPYAHTSEDKETFVPSKRRRIQPATDVSTGHAADTANCSDGGDSISSVDNTADNHCNVFNKAINAAAEAVSDCSHTCHTSHLASQSTENGGDYVCAPTVHLLYALGGASVGTAAGPSDSWS